MHVIRYQEGWGFDTLLSANRSHSCGNLPLGDLKLRYPHHGKEITCTSASRSLSMLKHTSTFGTMLERFKFGGLYVAPLRVNSLRLCTLETVYRLKKARTAVHIMDPRY